MDPYGNPFPSHSWDDPVWNNDNIENTLESMDLFSEQHAREDHDFPIRSPSCLITDTELLGILSENVFDEMETDTDDDPDTEAEDNEDEPSMQANVMPDEEWLSGNPSDLTEIPFLKNTGLKEVVGNEPINFFDALCTSELLELFKTCTNEYGEKQKTTSGSAQSRTKFWYPVTCEEIKLFFGVLFHMGFIKLNRINDYWKKDIFFNIGIFGQAMSRNRFLLLLRMICVSMGEVTSSYLKIKKIIDYFNARMLAIYYPTKDITIDESMILWRGRLRFRQYLKGKRHKYGLKFYVLADQLGVVMKLHLYGGATDTLIGGKNHVNKVVEYLLQDFKNVGHHLFVDNFYTSVDLVKKIFLNKTYCTGTLRPKRKNNPKIIESIKLKKGELCIVHQNNICIIKWVDRREIRAISSKYNGNLEYTRNRRGVYKLKPQMISKYNNNMKAVDHHDQMLSYYSFEHKSLRWYKKVIIHVMQVLLINSYLLYNKFSGKNVNLYDFRLSVIKSIIEPHLSSELARTPNKIHCIMRLTKDSKGKTKRRRCNQCWLILKKRVQSIFACEDCPNQPGLCIECFRPYHKY